MSNSRIPIFELESLTPQDLLGGLRSASCVFLAGVPAVGEALVRMLKTAREFYALPPEQKRSVQWSGQGEWAGWQPLYEEKGPRSLLLERYEFALPAPELFPSVAAWAASFDQWPAEPADFSAAWCEYYLEMRALASRLTAMLGSALGVPAVDLPAWTDRQHSNLCVNHYLAQADPPEEGRTRQNPHTDIGGITLLWADDNPGLEAQLADGAWEPVVFPPETLLVQAGDLLHLWSHGTVPANNHRVVNPSRDAVQSDRYSVVYFHHPDLETWVAPAVEAPDAAAMDGTNARDHVLERQRNAYA